jgi:glycosyltransferase involved in cell wall biosynthesis
MKIRRVLVLNHFAAPVGAPGGTRHVELFGRLEGWDATVLASNRNYLTRRTTRSRESLYRTVWTSRYSTNGLGRVLNWMTFAVTAFVVGLVGPKPDVVYASSPHLLAGLSGWALARLRRARFVLEIRDLWPRLLADMGQLSERSLLYRLLSGLARFLYRRADAVVVMAKGVESELLAGGDVTKDRIRFVPNGADPEDFVSETPRDELRRAFDLEGFVIVYAGAHGPANGLDLVLDAAAELKTDCPDVRFLLIGDGVAKAALMARAEHEGLSNVEFRASMPKNEIRPLFTAADAGVHVLADVPLFRYGVSPNKLFDYMAAGIPVITNTPGEVQELVAEAGAGLAVAPDGLAGAVREMVAAGSERRAAWGRSGRTFIGTHRSRRALAGELEDLLDLVVEASPARPALR